MELKLSDGDYVPNGLGGFARAAGSQELLARALFRLTCRRGAFPFFPELGSRLYLLAAEKPSARAMAARQYAAEALDGMGLTVADAAVEDGENGAVRVRFTLSAGEETTELEVTVS